MASKKTRKHNCGIWDEDYFIDVSAIFKLFYFYISDKSEYGVWRPNVKRFERENKVSIDLPLFLEEINKERQMVIQLESYATTIFFLPYYFLDNHDTQHKHELQMQNAAGRPCTWCAGFMRSLYQNNISVTLVKGCDNAASIDLEQLFGSKDKVIYDNRQDSMGPTGDVLIAQLPTILESQMAAKNLSVVYSTPDQHNPSSPPLIQLIDNKNSPIGAAKMERKIKLRGAIDPEITYTFDGSPLTKEFESFLKTNDWDNVCASLGVKTASELKELIDHFRKQIYGTSEYRLADGYKKFFFFHVKKNQENAPVKKGADKAVTPNNSKRDYSQAYKSHATET